LIYRFGKGIRILKSEQANEYKDYPFVTATGHSIHTAFKLPISVYFLNLDGATQAMNEEGALVCGYGSVENALGKTLFEVANTESAYNLIGNCKEVINTNSIKIYDEINTDNDQNSIQFLSFKSPWYDNENAIIGTFGCSIVLGKHSLAESLVHVKQLGMLDEDSNELLFGNLTLSKREMECLRLTIKGYTAKRIAKVLGISHRTVEEYITNIRLKVGVNSKSELIEMAIDFYLK
jgi:DNA-binding CsgD family transcriptional regulator